MDSDFTTAFAQAFDEERFLLRSAPERCDEVHLNMSFWVEDGSMALSVYDPKLRAYSHEFSSKDPAGVAPFLASVEADFGVKLPGVFQRRAEKYLRLLPQSLGVTGDLEVGDFEPCGQCGDYTGNEVEAFYFPPLREGGPASVGVHNNFGCFGGTSVVGDPRVVGAEAVSILEAALKGADESSVRREVEGFLAGLKQKLAEAN